VFFVNKMNPVIVLSIICTLIFEKSSLPKLLIFLNFTPPTHEAGVSNIKDRRS